MYFLGSKERFSKVINSLVNDKFNNLSIYCEPFAGGLNILPHLEKQFDKYYINDLSLDMYDLYINIKNNDKFMERIEKAKSLFDSINFEKQEEMFYKVREAFNKTRDPAYLFFLLHTCYQSHFRVNQKGEFNKSFGFRTSFNYDKEFLLKTKKLLKNSIITNLDYKDCIQGIDKTKCLFIFDPPFEGREYYSEKFNSLNDLIQISENTNSILFNFEIQCNLNKEYLNKNFKFAAECKKKQKKGFLYWNKI